MTTIRRIITSFLLTLFLLPRLDRPLVVAGWEWLDKGKKSYIILLQPFLFRLRLLLILCTS